MYTSHWYMYTLHLLQVLSFTCLQNFSLPCYMCYLWSNLIITIYQHVLSFQYIHSIGPVTQWFLKVFSPALHILIFTCQGQVNSPCWDLVENLDNDCPELWGMARSHQWSCHLHITKSCVLNLLYLLSHGWKKLQGLAQIKHNKRQHDKDGYMLLRSQLSRKKQPVSILYYTTVVI